MLLIYERKQKLWAYGSKLNRKEVTPTRNPKKKKKGGKIEKENKERRQLMLELSVLKKSFYPLGVLSDFSFAFLEFLFHKKR